jgi:hypothetical protein
MPAELKSIFEDKHGVLEKNDHVILVRFGTLNRNSGLPNLPFPYNEYQFSGHPEDLNQLRASFPTQATDYWTNKFLAEASAAGYFHDKGSPSWYMVMISDFNQDTHEKLLPNEAKLVDDYRAGRYLTVTSPAVLRLRSNPQVVLEVKFAAARKGTEEKRREAQQQPPTPPRLEPIAPRSNSTVEAGSPVVFSWHWSGDTPPGSYQLVATRADGSGTELSHLTRATSFTATQLKAGKYRWQVFAVISGQNIASSPVPFEIQEKGTNPLLWLGVLAALIFGMVYFLNQRRGKLKGGAI